MSKEELIQLTMLWTCYGIVVATSEFMVLLVLYHIGWSFKSIFTTIIATVLIGLLIYIYRIVFEEFEVSKEAFEVFLEELSKDLIRYNVILLAIHLISGLSIWNVVTATIIFIISSMIV